MKTAQLGDIFEWEGSIVKVVGIATGKVIYFEDLNNDNFCKCCGRKNNYSYLEDAPIFQQNAKPIKTINQ